MTTKKAGNSIIFSDMELNTIYIIDRNTLSTSPEALATKGPDDYASIPIPSTPPPLKKKKGYPLKQNLVNISKAKDLLCCYKFQKSGIDYYIVLNLTGAKYLLVINEQMRRKLYNANLFALELNAGKKAVAQLDQLHNIMLIEFNLYYDSSQKYFYCGCGTESYMYREELNSFYHALLDFLVLNPSEHPTVSKNLQNNLSDAYNTKRNAILEEIAATTTTVNNFAYIDVYNEVLEKVEIAAVYFDKAKHHCIFSDGYEDIFIEELLRRSSNGIYYIDNHNRTASYSARMIPADDEFTDYIDKYYEGKDTIETTDFYYDSGLLIKVIGNKIKISFVADVEREKNTCTFYKSNIYLDELLQLRFKKITQKAIRLYSGHYQEALNHFFVSLLEI